MSLSFLETASSISEIAAAMLTILCAVAGFCAWHFTSALNKAPVVAAINLERVSSITEKGAALGDMVLTMRDLDHKDASVQALERIVKAGGFSLSSRRDETFPDDVPRLIHQPEALKHCEDQRKTHHSVVPPRLRLQALLRSGPLKGLTPEFEHHES